MTLVPGVVTKGTAPTASNAVNSARRYGTALGEAQGRGSVALGTAGPLAPCMPIERRAARRRGILHPVPTGEWADRKQQQFQRLVQDQATSAPAPPGRPGPNFFCTQTLEYRSSARWLAPSKTLLTRTTR